MVKIKEQFKNKNDLEYVRFVVDEMRELEVRTPEECDAIIAEVEKCEAELGIK